MAQFHHERVNWSEVGLRSTLACCLLCLCSHDAVMDPDSEDKVHVAVDGLGGKFVIIYVGKKEGKEKEKLLADEGGTDEEDEEEEGGLWSRYSGVECSGCWRRTTSYTIHYQSSIQHTYFAQWNLSISLPCI